MSTRIIAKRWNNDEDQVITDLKLEDGRGFAMMVIWNDITNSGLEFHTFEDSVSAKVYAKTKNNGTKYLISNNDGVTENNLDELPKF